jgi:hypothetical protein
MPNRRTKEDRRAANRAAARKALREEEGARLRAKAIENTAAGKPSIISELRPLSVRQRKLQSAKGNDGKARFFSKSEIAARRKAL